MVGLQANIQFLKVHLLYIAGYFSGTSPKFPIYVQTSTSAQETSWISGPARYPQTKKSDGCPVHGHRRTYFRTIVRLVHRWTAMALEPGRWFGGDPNGLSLRESHRPTHSTMNLSSQFTIFPNRSLSSFSGSESWKVWDQMRAQRVC